MKAVLTRLSDNGKQTLGTMTVFDGDKAVFSCKTLEPAWLNNKFQVSCIPAKTYQVKKYVSPKFGLCFYVQGTAPRTAILIHSGNYRSHTLGCILVGKTHTDLNADGELDTTHSKATLKKLLSILPESFTLEIKGVTNDKDQKE